MRCLQAGLISKTQFDEPVEWTWFYLWHHEGRRARHGASMMVPTTRTGTACMKSRIAGTCTSFRKCAIIKKARETGKAPQADAAQAVVDKIMAKPEHSWYQGRQRRAVR